MPRLARTCEAVRPSRRSAVPSRCLRAQPMRVVVEVMIKTASSATNDPGPTLVNSTKQTIAPATAPERETPRTRCPTAAKPSVTAAMTPRRVGVVLHDQPSEIVTRNKINTIQETCTRPSRPADGANLTSNYHCWDRALVEPTRSCFFFRLPPRAWCIKKADVS